MYRQLSQALWKMIVLCAFVFLLWSHVDANSQTIPYMTFKGQTLPNNSYMDLRLVVVKVCSVTLT